MKVTTSFLTTLCLASLLFTSCGKKESDDADAPQKGPDPVAGSDSAPASSAMDGQRRSETPASSTDATASTTQPSGGVADLATTDVAYEAWFRKYGLDLNDPKMLDADSDGDGYTNREEFLADTSPKDPNARPGVHASIRLKDFTEVKVPFMLRSVDGDLAKIEHEESGQMKVETLKAGQMLHNSTFKIQKVESVQTQDKDGNPIDASKVTLEDSSNSQKVDLVKDMPARSTASYAVLTSPDGSASMTVRQGDTFQWPGETGATYRVVDLRNDQVILEQIENKKMWTIPKK